MEDRMCSLFSCCLNIALLVQLATAALGSDINAQFMDGDARLSRCVTLQPRKILVGDLLSELRKQTGVTISTDLRDEVAGIEVIVSCKDVRLCDLLDSLWGLLSNADGSYRWYREGRSPNFTYDLYE